MQDVVADEDAEDSEDEQDDHADEQDAGAGSEVVLALCGFVMMTEGEQGKKKYMIISSFKKKTLCKAQSELMLSCNMILINVQPLPCSAMHSGKYFNSKKIS